MSPIPADGPATEGEDGGRACCKCGLPVSDDDKGSFGKKSKQVVHLVCVTKYKAVSRKRSTDPTFKAWFDGKTKEQQADYYRSRYEAHLPQQKQKLQSMTASSREVLILPPHRTTQAKHARRTNTVKPLAVAPVLGATGRGCRRQHASETRRVA